jgi:hypothetical protein
MRRNSTATSVLDTASMGQRSRVKIVMLSVIHRWTARASCHWRPWSSRTPTRRADMRVVIGPSPFLISRRRVAIEMPLSSAYSRKLRMRLMPWPGVELSFGFVIGHHHRLAQKRSEWVTMI